MARGADEKVKVTNDILATFPGSFLYNGGKEIRIPVGDVQIKVALTCAKENVTPEDEVRVPGSSFPEPVVKSSDEENVPLPWNDVPEEKPAIKATDEEKALVQKLMGELNL